MTDEEYLALMRVGDLPIGERGLWLIDRFDVKEPEDMRGVVTPAGRYTSLRRLDVSGHGVGFEYSTWMSDVPLELQEALPFVRVARGDVLVTGLGLGTILRALVAKPDVRLVTVVEKDHHVRELVGPHYQDHPKIQIVPGDALTVDLAEPFDCAWHDIWPTINARNLIDMLALWERFDVRGPVMFWSIGSCIAQAREAEGEGKLPPGTADEIEKMFAPAARGPVSSAA